jgi:DNA invertase Pin-like site-specific DNA recombinase
LIRRKKAAAMSATVRAVIYARISHDPDKDKHEDGGASIERQIKHCDMLAAAREWELIREPLIDNDRSAFSGKARPRFTELMGMMARKEIDAVLVWHIDRLCCRMDELVDIAKVCLNSKIKIATVHGDFDFSSPVGKLFATILIAVAEYERAHKGTRQVAAYEQLAEMGHRHYGPRSFGYTNGKKADDTARHGQRFILEIEPDEAAAIAWAAQHVIAGGSIAEVMREWTRRGVSPTRSGRRWTRSSVLTILRNPAIAGLRAHNGVIVGAGQWEPVISEQMWRGVQAVLASPERKRVRGTRTLLGGLGLCQCGNVLQGAVTPKGKHVYRCNRATRGDRPGPHCLRDAAAVDNRVTVAIIARLAQPDLVELTRPAAPDLAALHTEATAIRENLDSLAADRALGLITRSQMLTASVRANERLDEIEAKLAAASADNVLAPFSSAESAQEVWHSLDLSRQRAVIDALCESITILASGPGRRFDADTIQITPRQPE